MVNILLEEEISSLQAIFENDIRITSSTSLDDVTITYSHEAATISFTCSSRYPDELPAVSCGILRRLNLLTELDAYLNTLRGAEMMFQAIEFIRGRLEESNELIGQHTCILEELSREDVPENVTASAKGELSSGVVIIHGPVTIERKSVFQSHFAYVSSMEQVLEFRRVVVTDKKYSRATHNIFAYRFEGVSGDKEGVVYHDFDDDGENAAGGRLAELIRLMGISGVAVIVSRWFGGILLGPHRFKYINNSAREMLELNGLGTVTAKGADANRSKHKFK
jgi:hypothetical protein